MPPSIVTPLRTLIAPFLVLALILSGSARADTVDRLIEDLRSSKKYKVRLSAALSLSKRGDARAIPAFARALRDDDKTVRGVAAAALGKLVTSSTPPRIRSKVLAVLERSAAKDENAFVRKQAKKAIAVLEKLDSGGAVSAGATYVNIGTMSAEADDAAGMRALMKKTVQKTFEKKARGMVTSWPGGRDPSRKQLAAKKVTAFYVDGTLNELVTREVGSSTTVSCKVSMLLATYPDKSMFGFLKGGAQVQAGSSARDVQYAKEDCVAAVVEDLIARKIIPTIETRTR